MRVASEAATPMVRSPRSSPNQGVPGGRLRRSGPEAHNGHPRAVGLAPPPVKAHCRSAAAEECSDEAHLFGTALVLLTACDPSAESRTAEIEQADSQAAAAAAPALTAAGPDAGRGRPRRLSAVVGRRGRVDAGKPGPPADDQTVRHRRRRPGHERPLHPHRLLRFGVAEGWRVFRIGDFLDYRILADAPGGSIWRFRKASSTRPMTRYQPHPTSDRHLGRSGPDGSARPRPSRQRRRVERLVKTAPRR
jgi:hypothetical protein